MTDFKQELTDREVAVISDSLAFMRDYIQSQIPEKDTPNIDSALNAIHKFYGPGSNGIRFEVINPHDFSK